MNEIFKFEMSCLDDLVSVLRAGCQSTPSVRQAFKDHLEGQMKALLANKHGSHTVQVIHFESSDMEGFLAIVDHGRSVVKDIPANLEAAFIRQLPHLRALHKESVSNETPAE